MARYQITHRTEYLYSSNVSLSRQLLHTHPRQVDWQSIESANLSIEPRPAQRTDRSDIFGNPCTWLEFSQPHQTLVICAEMTVTVNARALPDLDSSPPWQDIVSLCRYRGVPLQQKDQLEALMFRQQSPHVRIKHDFAEYAGNCFPVGRPHLAGANALMQKIHEEFIFDAEATTIGTPLTEVLLNKRGVCQDFAHLMIACLRSLGLPARYISGYLLTQPPPGQPRLIGADASHAWVSVWCPVNGWIDFDPTNCLLPGDQHITLAWGRDFSDISPLRGVIVGGGEHELNVAVTVMPCDSAALVPPAPPVAPAPVNSQSQSQGTDQSQSQGQNQGQSQG